MERLSFDREMTWYMDSGRWIYRFPFEGDKPNFVMFISRRDPEMDERIKADTLADLLKARAEYPNVVRHGEYRVHAGTQACAECR